MLRTADDLIAALRSRKEALGLSNAVVDEIAGYTTGWWDKVAGPSRMKSPSLATLMALCGALGLAVQLVEDPDTVARRRWTKRRHPGAKSWPMSVKRARPIVLAELARKGGRSWWARMTPEQRQAHIAKLNAARATKRQTGLNKAA
jgi:Helix-turn-helix domain